MDENGPDYVAIEGPIGVGKTTLARMLGEALGAELLLEVFEENPFLSAFYSDPNRYAFQTQVFFLLSRYRQQRHVIHRTLLHHSLVSDYMFDKDRLFAQLTLSGDELHMYDRVQAILGEQIPTPDLVVFLRARTDDLMRRISYRDRAYERAMSRQYIERLRVAYEQFFSHYCAAPVLSIDTSNLDIVGDPDARGHVIGRIQEALSRGVFQQPLPRTEPVLEAQATAVLPGRRRISDLQRWHRASDSDEGILADLYFNFISLMEQIGELGSELKAVWEAQERMREGIGNRYEARERALETRTPHLQEELADCLAQLLKLANLTGVDLEASYLARMNLNRGRA